MLKQNYIEGKEGRELLAAIVEPDAACRNEGMLCRAAADANRTISLDSEVEEGFLAAQADIRFANARKIGLFRSE